MGFGRVQALRLRVVASRPPRRLPVSTTPPPKIRVPPFYNTPSLTQLTDEETDEQVFLLSISEQDRQVYHSGHRLSKLARDEYVNQLSPADREKWGVRFSDEPSPTVDDPPALQQLRHDRSRGHPHPVNVRIKQLLRDLWHFAHPLLLELAVDAHTMGINLAFNGDRHRRPGPAVPNLPPDLLQRLIQEIEQDIEKGYAVGWFDSPPFSSWLSVASNLVPKKSPGAYRVVKDYTRAELNNSCDHPSFPYLAWAVHEERFRAVGPGSVSVTWDGKAAFQQFRIRLQDQHLTCSFIPGRGWYYRSASDFGSTTASHRWEALGGRLLTSCYMAMSHRCNVDQRDIAHLAPPPAARNSYPDLADTSLYPPGFADMELDAGTILTKEGLSRLQREREEAAPLQVDLLGLSRLRRECEETTPLQVDLFETSRWVDDWSKSFKDADLAAWAAASIIMLHARYGSPLEPDKFFVNSTFEFGGITFDGESFTKSLAPSKFESLRESASVFLLHDKVSLRQIQRVFGVTTHVIRAFPSLRAHQSGILTILRKATRACSRKPGPPPHAFVFEVNERLRRDADRWVRVATELPCSNAAFIRDAPTTKVAEHATVFFHSDWAKASSRQLPVRERDTLAVVELVTGKWTLTELPDDLVSKTVINSDSSSPAREALGLLLALASFKDLVRGKAVVLFCDNLATVQAFQKPSRNGGPLGDILTAVDTLQAQLSCLLYVTFVPTTENLADPLSRLLMQDFFDRMTSSGLSALPYKIKASLPATLICWTKL